MSMLRLQQQPAVVALLAAMAAALAMVLPNTMMMKIQASHHSQPMLASMQCLHPCMMPCCLFTGTCKQYCVTLSSYLLLSATS